MTDPPAAGPEDALVRFFDLTTFRPGQREALDAVLAGSDTLVVLPTGAGKSLIYQVAGLLLPGVTLIVSPLIALMRDQTERLRERAISGVGVLHSQILESEQRATLVALREGRLRMLYVTPERCASDDFLAVAAQADVSLLAVDEAHCISEWGHDFRPSYLLLDDAARALGRPPTLALTATATPWVREQISERLQLRSPRVIVRGFDRPNLFFEVQRVDDEREKRRILGSAITGQPSGYPPAIDAELRRAGVGSAIVYTALTRSARALSQWMNQQGVHAAYYHGQLRAAARAAVHQRFSAGTIRAIAATNAFGLGIDRADLRFVAHYDVPGSVEAYYQEAGRAGRDGAFSRCLLLYAESDLGRAAFAGGSGGIDDEALERIAETLQRVPDAGLTRTVVAAQTGLSRSRVIRGLELLVAAGAAGERHGRYRPRDLTETRVQAARDMDERRRQHDRTRLDMLRAYATIEGCRRQFLLRYFGQYDAPERCGMCDTCVTPRLRRPAAAMRPEATNGSEAFRVGDSVEHRTWGIGIVLHRTEDRLTVHFPDAGYRTLDLAAVLEDGIVQRRDQSLVP